MDVLMYRAAQRLPNSDSHFFRGALRQAHLVSVGQNPGVLLKLPPFAGRDLIYPAEVQCRRFEPTPNGSNSGRQLIDLSLVIPFGPFGV